MALRWNDIKPELVSDQSTLGYNCRPLLWALRQRGKEVIAMDAARRLQYSTKVAQPNSGCLLGEHDCSDFLPEMLLHLDLTLDYMNDLISPRLKDHPGLADALAELVRLGAPLHEALGALFGNKEHMHHEPLVWAQALLMPVIQHGRGDELLASWGPEQLVDAVSYFDSPPIRTFIRNYGADISAHSRMPPCPPASSNETAWLVSALRRCGATTNQYIDAAFVFIKDMKEDEVHQYGYLLDASLLRLRKWNEVELRLVRFLERSLQQIFPEYAASRIAACISGQALMG